MQSLLRMWKPTQTGCCAAVTRVRWETTVSSSQTADNALLAYQLPQSREHRLQKIPRYQPPADVGERVHKLISNLLPANCHDFNAAREAKFKLLIHCMREFNHPIPNSRLCELRTAQDVIDYFSTPVDHVDYLYTLRDAAAQGTLPPNVVVQTEPIRFHPEKDTFFGGITAFPGRDTVVCDISAKRKFASFRADKTRAYKIDWQNL